MSVRLATLHDLPALQQFFHQHWRANHILSRDRDLFTWQYGRGISGHDADVLSMFVFEADHAIQGILGFLPVHMSLGTGRRVPGAWLSHWLVLDKWRAGGAGLHLLHALRKLGNEVIAVLGINDTVKELYRRLGFAIIDDLPRYLAILDPCQAAALAATIGLDIDDAELQKLAAPTTIDLPAETQIQPGHPTHPGIGAWLNSWMQTHPGTCRDADYLHWRYQSHPSFRYHHLVALADGKPVGLATYRLEHIRDHETPVLRITDLLADGAVAGALVAEVLTHGRRLGAAFADFYSSANLDTACLEAGLFLPAAGSPLAAWPSRLQPLDSGYTWMSGAVWAKAGNHLLTTPDTYLSKSDGDVDRPN